MQCVFCEVETDFKNFNGFCSVIRQLNHRQTPRLDGDSYRTTGVA